MVAKGALQMRQILLNEIKGVRTVMDGLMERELVKGVKFIAEKKLRNGCVQFLRTFMTSTHAAGPQLIFAHPTDALEFLHVPGTYTHLGKRLLQAWQV